MSYQHADLAGGRWKTFTFLEQMANIASEVERALNWRAKNNPAYAQRALERALELLDLTLIEPGSASRLRELTTVREALVDFFTGNNVSASTDALWRKYFAPFTYAARRTH